ncbi:hypothetical protein Tco_0728087 [Tanacetum coccineum]|uniref:Retrovirus-related Pol polyprotein from transposon TNT 1-94-like beta-barrel domain-containing protein n=1 Tax=Tanacetum coccineum TaxID=301880 RepID=A0ABQ4YL89_9ASTR
MMVIRGWYDDDDGCGRLSRDSSFERGGGKMVRVRESDGRDRIHREVGSLFGLRRICPPENFSGGGEWWPAAGDGGRILGKKMMIVDEETLILEELNQLSEYFVKRFVLQQELSDEQAFWLQTSHPKTHQSALSPVKIEAPLELPKEKKVKLEMDETETINIELEHSVAKLLFENERLHKEIEHLKKIYKDQFDSIKKTRALSKEHGDSLISQLKSKSVENADLKHQIQDKVFVITSLKNDLQKLKGKETIENVAQIPIATIIAPGMFNIDLEPLAPRSLKNREAYIDYIKHTQEQADILQGIVEQAKAKQLLDNALDFATVRFGNDQVAKIIGYGDYQLGNIIISRVYYVEGLGHNLFSVGQFCDADLEVGFRKTLALFGI